MAKTMNKDLKMISEVVQKPISLDEIIHEYSLLASELELGEFTEEIEKRLEINQENINKKLLGYRYVILNNEAKINSIYKPEIEKLAGRIKKFEHINKYLKGKCCVAAEIFGTNNKYTSDTINVSSVETVSLDTADEEVQKSLDQIKQCIINNNVEDITVEDSIVDTSLLIKASPKILAQIYEFITEGFNNMWEGDELITSVTLKRKEAKELVQQVNEINNNLQLSYDVMIENCNEDEKDNIPKPQFRTIEFKGLSLKSTYSPRFS